MSAAIEPQAAPATEFVDRRQALPNAAGTIERRQFGNTHYGLSPALVSWLKRSTTTNCKIAVVTSLTKRC